MTKEQKASGPKPPEEMTCFEALAILFPDYDGRSTAIEKFSWPAFNPPRPLLDIDKAVEDLIKSKKINAQEWKRKHRGGCPYGVARYGVALAVLWASHAKQGEAELRDAREAGISAEEESRDLAKKLREFLDKTPKTTFAPKRGRGTAGTDHEELAKALRASLEAYRKIRAAAEALEILSTMAKAACPSEQRVVAKEWAATFIEELSLPWLNLTGDSPKQSDPDFEDFLESAYRSLGGDHLKISWKNQIRKTLKRVRERPGWNSLNEHWKEKMRSVIMELQSSDAEIQRNAFDFLYLEYLSGPRINKEFLLRLGYSPPPIPASAPPSELAEPAAAEPTRRPHTKSRRASATRPATAARQRQP